VLGT
jgi:hypothetical protein